MAFSSSQKNHQRKVPRPILTCQPGRSTRLIMADVHLPTSTDPSPIATQELSGNSRHTRHHALLIHTAKSTTHTTVPPHFTVFLILGCGFTPSA
jgi:hypothetical protein